jgi:GT2 family glycosyltransferase
MQLSVVIVNYNVRYFLEQALHAVRRASEGLSVEVFVVDNNSVDDSVAMVREKFPEVVLLANQENVGFSRANNQAIAQARGEYVLLLNPDTVVEESTFHRCLSFMRAHPDCGGLGVKMIDGKGNFLPESKRGFPSPSVAFYKTFGLSRLFPRSPVFNRYHLGYLSPDETHAVEVLSGAFMMMPKKVLDEIGYLDETFFMYGEDIDLSYRILQAGYRNYYFADTCIIHYKGESTKKGSLNYVRTFYQAMIIFARKHFSGGNARLFVLMLQAAIWFRAGLALGINFAKKAWLPTAEALLVFAGLFFIKNTWATFRFHDPGYFLPSLLYFNFPLYVAIWLGAVYLNGGYDDRRNVRGLLRGLLFGTVVIAAVYGFLDSSLRSSRMLIVLGAVWAIVSTVGLRILLGFLLDREWLPDGQRRKNLIVVGHEPETERVMRLLQKAQVEVNFIGTVSPGETPTDSRPQGVLGKLYQLSEIADLYRVEEIIFCSKDLPSEDIIRWMSRLGPFIDYKILPEGSLSIIGSNSKNTAGDLYTIDIRFAVAQPVQARNKRLLDGGVALAVLGLFPLLMFFGKKFRALLPAALLVLFGKKTWVGYIPLPDAQTHLPPLRPGVFTPAHAARQWPEDTATLERLNFLYAKDYSPSQDLEVLTKALRGKA